MVIIAFLAGLVAMYVLCGLLFRISINSVFGKECEDKKLTIFESLLWPVAFSSAIGADDDE
jgi:hypothetical protein